MWSDDVTEDDLGRVRDLLRYRVEAYSDELSSEMLRVLGRLVVLRDSTRPAVDAALTAFVAACRKAAFDRSFLRADPEPLPEVDDVGATSPGDHADIRAIIDALDSLEQRIRNDAEVQEEWLDARLTAIEWWAAADYVRRARGYLAACLRAGGEP